MDLNIPLGQIPRPGRAVGTSNLDPEEVVSSGVAVVSNGHLEIHGIPSHHACAAECDLVGSSLDESQNLRRNHVNVLLLVLIIQVTTHRVVSIEAEVDNFRENASASRHLHYRTWRRRRWWRRRRRPV